MRKLFAPGLVAALTVLAVGASGCRERTDAGTPRGGAALPQASAATSAGDSVETCPPPLADPRATPAPRYLARMAALDLYVRTSDGGIGKAAAEDVAVARAYPTATTRGPLVDGMRITLLAAKTRVTTGEEVRVLHVVEAEVPGKELYVMGPKPVVGEYLDGKLVTPPVPSVGAFTTEVYDGAVLASPEVDTNYDVTRYTFASAGIHRIEWRDGAHRSNVLCIEVR